MNGESDAVRAGSRPGRRETKKQRTRMDLVEAAVRLFQERGYEGVTVDDIVADAEVSRRTFFRYFKSKDQVVFADQAEVLQQLRDALEERPDDEPPLIAVREAIAALARQSPDDRARMTLQRELMAETPGLRGHYLRNLNEWEAMLSRVLADRLGVDSEVDPEAGLLPPLIAACAVAALRVATTAWAHGEDCGGAELRHNVATAFDLLAEGLGAEMSPVPSR